MILTGTKDLLNPEYEPIEAGKNITGRQGDDDQPRHRDRPCVGRGAIPADVEFLNKETRLFLDSAKKPD